MAIVLSGSLILSGSLEATGGVTISGSIASASYASTGSYSLNALTSSNAMTASSADSLYVRSNVTALGTITAQTLNVQQVTSSVEFITGSTKFGTIQANTHEFTGSFGVTGSATFMGANVGIGTTSPSALLSFGSAVNAKQILVFESGTAFAGLGMASGEFRQFGWSSAAQGLTWGFISTGDGTTYAEKMRLTAAGNVGIGTASPSQLLHLNASSGAVYSRVQNNNNSLYLGLESGGIAQVSSDVSSLKVMGATYISFETSGSERMRITSAGNVGIGTASPSWKLDVRGDGMFNGTLQLDNNELNTPKTLLFSANISSGANTSLGAISWKNVQWDSNIKAQIEATTDSDITTARLVFKTGASGAAATERMRINSTGNVAIGTTSVGTLSSSYRSLDVRGPSGGGFLMGTVDKSYEAYLYADSTGMVIQSGGNNANITFLPNGTERLRITSGGNLLIGTTSDPGYKLNVNGTIQGTRLYASSNYLAFFPSYNSAVTWEIGSDSAYPGIYFYNASGGYAFRMTIAGSATFAGGVTSDRRVKENILPITNNAIDFIKELNPVSYEFIGDTNNKTRRGFIAQEVLETSIPDLVLGDGDKEGGTYGLDYDGILALAVKAIQEQQAQIDELKAQLQ